MATSNQALVRDSSTLTNYKQWAKAISDFFTTCGWSKSSDTGQVNWSTISTVPSNSITRDYEIWQPGDGLQTLYLKVQYGTDSGSANTAPQLAFSVGTSTNGAGTLTGFVTSTQIIPNQNVVVTNTVIQYQCYFSGDSGRMALMLWVDDPQSSSGYTAPVFFAIQRSLNSSGTPYGTSTTGYVTLLTVGENSSNNQQSLVFNVGLSNVVGSNTLICLKRYGQTSDLFAGGIPISPVFPDVGYFDNPMDIVAVGCSNDFTERAQYNIPSGQMPYGVSHNYIASKAGRFTTVGQQGQNNSALLMRYD